MNFSEEYILKKKLNDIQFLFDMSWGNMDVGKAKKIIKTFDERSKQTHDIPGYEDAKKYVDDLKKRLKRWKQEAKSFNEFKHKILPDGKFDVEVARKLMYLPSRDIVIFSLYSGEKSVPSI
jgi:predicted CopG family antitoxin